MSEILLVEDDADLRTIIGEGLTADGHAVRAAASGRAALDELAAATPDLLLLDLGLGPGPDGVEICRRLRGAETDVFVMVLTARGSEADAVYALEAGADDYLVKPVGLAELRSRVRAALRRLTRGEPQTGELRRGDLAVDLAARTARAGERALSLTPSELRVLEALLEAAGAVRSRAQLLEAVFGDARFRDPRAIDVHVHHLREKVAAAGGDPGAIVTVRGAGYRIGG